MSKLEELIARLCPDGVEYKSLGEIANISRGKVMSKDYLRDNVGDYPVYSSQTENDGKLGSISTYMVDGDYLTWTTDGANAGTVFFRSGKFSITNVCGLIDVTDKNVLIRFLYYALFKEAPNHVNAGMGNPKLMSNVMSKIKIPVPPLEVQREIVHILDSYTVFNDELQEQLEKELVSRQKQYEYYRESLIIENNVTSVDNEKSFPVSNIFGNPIEYKTLAEIGTLKRGKRFVHSDATDNGVPCIHYGELYTYYGVSTDTTKSHIREELRNKMRYAQKNDVVIVGAGENNIDIGIGVAYLGEEEVAVHDACYIFKHNQNPKYISYCLRTFNYHDQIKKYVSRGKICSISAESLYKAKIPVPPLAEQQRIVDILDRFDALCNDITSGLPAEIEARRKQYEYYRDKLLTFKELKKEA